MTDRMLPGNAVWILRNGDILIRAPILPCDGRYIEPLPPRPGPLPADEDMPEILETRGWELLQWDRVFGRPGRVQIWVEI
ncbi:MAG: hypothetical protein GY701_22060 [Sulfitobacter sp.]|nr:hypothetical protein [Sulfitobacter sp.]